MIILAVSIVVASTLTGFRKLGIAQGQDLWYSKDMASIKCNHIIIIRRKYNA
jgi:hypothetical protein